MDIIKLVFYSGSKPFQKVQQPDGSFVPAPFQKNLTSITVDLDLRKGGPEKLRDVLEAKARQGLWLAKGQVLKKPLVNESRSEAMDLTALTSFMVLDIDGITHPGGLDGVLSDMGLTGVRYVYQYSSSQQFESVYDKSSLAVPLQSAPIHAHVFILLETPVEPIAIRDFLTRHSLDNGWTSLNATTDGLKYKLDPNLALNGACLLITPPKLHPAAYTWCNEDINVLAASRHGFRTAICGGATNARYEQLPAAFISRVVAKFNRESFVHRRVNQLRETIGLPTRPRLAYQDIGAEAHEDKVIDFTVGEHHVDDAVRTVRCLHVLKNPSKHTLEIVKEERGFYYLRAEGKTSATFYMSATTRTGLLRSWCDDSYVARLADVDAKLAFELRELWSANALSTELDTDPVHAEETLNLNVIRDAKSGRTRGILTVTKAGQLIDIEITPISNRKDVRDFCISRGFPFLANEPVRDGYVKYNPAAPSGVSINKRWRGLIDVNPYKYPLHMFNKVKVNGVEKGKVPPFIGAVIRHVLGGCPVHYKRMLDWLAYIAQIRLRGDGECQAQTAWVLLGAAGTGKGTLAGPKTSIIAQTFGPDNLAAHGYARFASEISTKMQDNRQFLTIDEANRDSMSLQAVHSFTEAVKLLVTESERIDRAFFADPTMAINTINLIITSNSTKSPIKLDPKAGDRRFLFPPYQETPIADLIQEMGEKYGFTCKNKRIAEEAPWFWEYLTEHHPMIEFDDIREPIKSDHFHKLLNDERTHSRSVGYEISTGDWSLIFDTIEELNNTMLSAMLPAVRRSNTDYGVVAKHFARSALALIEHTLYTTPDPHVVECPSCRAVMHTERSVKEAKERIAAISAKHFRVGVFFNPTVPNQLVQHVFAGHTLDLPVVDRVAVADLTDNNPYTIECPECHTQLGLPSRRVTAGAYPGIETQEVAAAREHAISSMPDGYIWKPIAMTLPTVAPLLRQTACTTDATLAEWLDSGQSAALSRACDRAGMSCTTNTGEVALFDSAKYLRDRANPGRAEGWVHGAPASLRVTYTVSMMRVNYSTLLAAYETLLNLDVTADDAFSANMSPVVVR